MPEDVPSMEGLAHFACMCDKLSGSEADGYAKHKVNQKAWIDEAEAKLPRCWIPEKQRQCEGVNDCVVPDSVQSARCYWSRQTWEVNQYEQKRQS